MKECISTSAAPEAVGPYSQAIIHGGLVFVSGQLGLSPETGALISPSVNDQTAQALKNLEAVLRAAGASMRDVVKVTVYVMDMADFHTVNEVYARFFSEPYPARACVEVAALPKGGLVEIEAVACVPG